jgi:hypothetical protein
MSDRGETTGQASESRGNWVRHHPWMAALVVLVVVIAAWTAWDAKRTSDRKSDGYVACEKAVRAELLSGYDPELSVTFEEEQPNGAFAYTVLTDDGDGQFTCTVSKIGKRLTTDVVNGLVYN